MNINVTAKPLVIALYQARRFTPDFPRAWYLRPWMIE